MMRKLNPKERELTKKGISNKEKELEDLKQTYEVLFKYSEYLKMKRSYEDYARPINRKKEDQEIKMQTELKKQEVNSTIQVIQEMYRHLKDGVKEK